ncbi:MAG TPA: alpha/beta hydrolase [Longimicrobiaceae bacterium]|jgi:pimeloyl-ACP methyl ester carboxylesterase|nr:alpha/beta hydrolase [Longimicrobiaceae bacterium]
MILTRPLPRPPFATAAPAAAHPGRQPAPVLRSLRDVGPYRIHSLEAGEGDECVVLLHGLSGSSRWWDRNVADFAGRFRVLVPDMIGFGRSRLTGPLPDMAGAAAVLADWMEAAGAGRVHLVGHSMGGQLAIHLAARFPERISRLVLADASGIPRPLSARSLIRFARDVAPPARWGDPAFIPVIVGDAFKSGPLTILRALGNIVRDDVRPLLPRIQAPTLLVWGERDALVPVRCGREMRKTIPNSRLVVIPRAAHNPMVDRPAEFAAAVLPFLAGVEVGQ